jgi:DNA-binding beta-propeller fold protein YncE
MGSYKNKNGAGQCSTCAAGTRFLPAGHISVLAGSTAGGYVDDVGTKAKFSWYRTAQSNLALTPDHTEVLVVSGAVRAIHLVSGQVRTLSGGNGAYGDGDGPGPTAQYRNPQTIRTTPNGTAVVVNEANFRVVNITDGSVRTFYTFHTPSRMNLGALGVTPDGTKIWVADEYYHSVFQVEIETGTYSEVAGIYSCEGAGGGNYADGHAEVARFENPGDIAFTPDGSTALVAEAYHVRTIDVATRQVSILAGGPQGFQDGVGTNARFSSWILHVVITPDGKTAYVGCYEGNFADSIRKIDLASRAVTTVVDRQHPPHLPYAWMNDG